MDITTRVRGCDGARVVAIMGREIEELGVKADGVPVTLEDGAGWAARCLV